MPKKTHDYDNVFKTMKIKHKRLFIPVINDIFGKNYPLDTKVGLLPSEGYLTETETSDGSKEIEEQISDFLMKIGGETYLLECQSYDDGSMAIRIAEYAFLAARQAATWDNGHATIRMPEFSIIYVRKTHITPKKTTITFAFPDGQRVDYESDNVLLENLTKEYIVEKRLFPYIPFYITRYENELIWGNAPVNAVSDLIYFRDEMSRLHEKGELADNEIVDLMGFVNTIITHITDGNQNEERLVHIMGGTIIETESEKLIRIGKAEGKAEGKQEGKAQMLIEISLEEGLDHSVILEKLQDKIGMTFEQANAFLEQYGEQLA